MEILLQKAKIDEGALKILVSRLIAKHLSHMTEPCYFPPHKELYFSLLNITGLNDSDIKEFTKRRWKGRKEAAFKLHMDPAPNFYIFLMQLQTESFNSYTNISKVQFIVFDCCKQSLKWLLDHPSIHPHTHPPTHPSIHTSTRLFFNLIAII